MKTENGVFEKIIKKENIRLAIQNASKGKKNRSNVKKILQNEVFFVDEIYNMLKNKTYKPSPYIKTKIFDGNRKKERIIYKPQFYPDQIIHWCLMQQLTPIIMRGMYEYCCASIPGRGIHYAANHIKRILKEDRKNTKYCLIMDIKKYYPSVNLKKLKKKYRRILRDKDALELNDLIIDNSPDGGLPIGDYPSQWDANFNLQDLDHFIKEKLHVKHYVRYMDDMIIFHRNKKELHKIKDEIEKYLEKEDLKIKENWQLFRTDSRPVDFIGYRFYRGYTTLRRGTFLRIKRRAKKIYKRGYIRRSDGYAMISYNGWLKHCNSYNFRTKYIKPYFNIKECKEGIKYGRYDLKCRKHRKTTKGNNRKN